MNRTFAAIVAVSVLTFTNLGAQVPPSPSTGYAVASAKFATDNLKYSRDFYAKVHFVAIAKLPQAFKYDRYPSNGPERIQCDDGTYLRQHGQPWKHVNQSMRTGLPIDYAERDRYVMTFASKDDWGRFGEPVDEETTRKLNGWIKLIDAALNAAPATMKPADKSESEGRAQWIFEAASPPSSDYGAPGENPNGAPTRFTFRKPASDKSDNVLLHEFSGSMRLEGDKVVPASAADTVRLGFGYMMKADGEHEVSERVWEEMQDAKK